MSLVGNIFILKLKMCVTQEPISPTFQNTHTYTYTPTHTYKKKIFTSEN